MAYVCHQCETAYHDEPEDGCQGSEQCSRGARQSLTWYPGLSVHAAQRRLDEGTLDDDPTANA